MTELLLILAGLASGSIGAVLGLGGGIILMPILVLLFGLPFTSAAGISLTALIGTSLSSSTGYLSRGWVDFELAAVLVLATTFGAMAGGISAGFLDPKILHILFAAALLYAAFNMMRKNSLPASDDPQMTKPTSKQYFLGMAGALAAGWVSSVLGVGGGVITVPIICLLLGRDINIARGTSSYMIGITGTTGALIYLFQGRIEIIPALYASCGTMVGAYIGAIVGARIKARVIKVLFAVVLIYTAISMVQKAFGE